MRWVHGGVRVAVQRVQGGAVATSCAAAHNGC